jgi:hypothetical protein
MTEDRDPIRTLRKVLERTWHSSGCATHVGPEDGGGYCTPGCVVYEAGASLEQVERWRDALREIAAGHWEKGDPMSQARTALEPFGTTDSQPATEEPDLEPLWADVLLHPETHTPTLLTDDQRNEANEALSDILAGEWLERCWIQAGPLHAGTTDSEEPTT